MTEIIVLRLVHILGGIFWLGSGMFTTWFLMPALGKVGPAAGPLMGALGQSRLYSVLPIVATLTMLSGARLLHLVSGGFAPAYMATRTGQALLWGGIAAIVAFLLSLAVARPAMVRAGALGASLAAQPDDQRAARSAEIARLQRRGTIATRAAMTLLVLSASAMAVARYLG